eukprot:106350_1
MYLSIACAIILMLRNDQLQDKDDSMTFQLPGLPQIDSNEALASMHEVMVYESPRAAHTLANALSSAYTHCTSRYIYDANGNRLDCFNLTHLIYHVTRPYASFDSCIVVQYPSSFQVTSITFNQMLSHGDQALNLSDSPFKWHSNHDDNHDSQSKPEPIYPDEIISMSEEQTIALSVLILLIMYSFYSVHCLLIFVFILGLVIPSSSQCVLKVLSIDHASSPGGMYFNFDKEIANHLLDNTWWNEYVFTVYVNWDYTQPISVMLWNEMNGGSIGTAHGRKNPKSSITPNDWSVDDIIEFADKPCTCTTSKVYADIYDYPCTFTVASNDHSEKSDGMYFNFWADDVAEILNTWDFWYDTYYLYNSRTHAVVEVMIWNTMEYGSIGSAHGRREPRSVATTSDWEIGDELAFVNYPCGCKPVTTTPTSSPSARPTIAPTSRPSAAPTIAPTSHPSTIAPTAYPSVVPIIAPSVIPTQPPSTNPALAPTINPSGPTLSAPSPSAGPSKAMSATPTEAPSESPIESPTASSTKAPSRSPIQSPSVSPSTRPTNPTINPLPYTSVLTVRSTVNPSRYQTESENPSMYSTTNPSIYPSTNPTENPSVIPSVNTRINPLQSRNIDETTNVLFGVLDYDEKEVELDVLRAMYQSTAGGFVLLCLFVAMTGYIDSRWIRTNDYFEYLAIGTMMLATLDMISDCFFAVEVSIQRNNYVDLELEMRVIFYASVLFIALPALVALFQLHFYTSKYWLEEGRVTPWIQKYMIVLLLFSIVTGNSFAAVSLMNSGLYNMDVFYMGLTKYQLQTFNIQKMYSIVFLENLPQLCLQSYYIWISENVNNPIAISSIIFSMVSIIVSAMHLSIEKQINYQQKYVIVKLHITGEYVEQKLSNCKTLSHDLKRGLGKYLNKDAKRIEIIKPTDINHGVKVRIIITKNGRNQRQNDNDEKDKTDEKFDHDDDEKYEALDEDGVTEDAPLTTQERSQYVDIFEDQEAADVFEENWKLSKLEMSIDAKATLVVRVQTIVQISNIQKGYCTI